jgi:hypothetical protein
MEEIQALQRAIEQQTEAAKAQARAELQKTEALQRQIEETQRLREAEEERLTLLEQILAEVQATNEILNSVVSPTLDRNATAIKIILEIQRLIIPKLVIGTQSEEEVKRLVELLKSATSHEINIRSERDTNIQGDVNEY